MKLLLDTHIFLWFINAVSFWEVAVKYRLGKLPLPDSPEIFLPAYCSLHRIQLLPLEPECSSAKLFTTT